MFLIQYVKELGISKKKDLVVKISRIPYSM